MFRTTIDEISSCGDTVARFPGRASRKRARNARSSAFAASATDPRLAFVDALKDTTGGLSADELALLSLTGTRASIVCIVPDAELIERSAAYAAARKTGALVVAVNSEDDAFSLLLLGGGGGRGGGLMASSEAEAIDANAHLREWLPGGLSEVRQSEKKVTSSSTSSSKIGSNLMIVDNDDDDGGGNGDQVDAKYVTSHITKPLLIDRHDIRANCASFSDFSKPLRAIIHKGLERRNAESRALRSDRYGDLWLAEKKKTAAMIVPIVAESSTIREETRSKETIIVSSNTVIIPSSMPTQRRKTTTTATATMTTTSTSALSLLSGYESGSGSDSSSSSSRNETPAVALAVVNLPTPPHVLRDIMALAARVLIGGNTLLTSVITHDSLTPDVRLSFLQKWSPYHFEWIQRRDIALASYSAKIARELRANISAQPPPPPPPTRLPPPPPLLQPSQNSVHDDDDDCSDDSGNISDDQEDEDDEVFYQDNLPDTDGELEEEEEEE